MLQYVSVSGNGICQCICRLLVDVDCIGESRVISRVVNKSNRIQIMKDEPLCGRVAMTEIMTQMFNI